MLEQRPLPADSGLDPDHHYFILDLTENVHARRAVYLYAALLGDHPAVPAIRDLLRWLDITDPVDYAERSNS